MRECTDMIHVANASGRCMFGCFSTSFSTLPDFLTADTGHACTLEEIIGCGERPVIVGPACAVRQGVNPVQQALPGRAYGRPPRPNGPTRDVAVNMPHMGKERLEEMRWTLQGAAPTADKLGALGMDDVARSLGSLASSSPG